MSKYFKGRNITSSYRLASSLEFRERSANLSVQTNCAIDFHPNIFKKRGKIEFIIFLQEKKVKVKRKKNSQFDFFEPFEFTLFLLSPDQRPSTFYFFKYFCPFFFRGGQDYVPMQHPKWLPSWQCFFSPFFTPLS